MKRIASLLLVLSLCLTPALAAQPGFSDVPGDAWYAPYVQVCTEAGLMEGTGKGAFSPAEKLTTAQAITLAARLHWHLSGASGALPTGMTPQVFYGTLFPGGDADPETLSQMEKMSHTWYWDAVCYLGQRDGASAHPLVHQPDEPASRGEAAALLAFAAGDLEPLNQVDLLPDEDSPAVLSLYRAGILTGKDRNGTFDGAGLLSRAETTAMLARILRPALRIRWTPGIDLRYTLTPIDLSHYDARMFEERMWDSGYPSTPYALQFIQITDNTSPEGEGTNWGWMDKFGSVIVPPIYDAVTDFCPDGCCAVRKDDRYGFLDLTGREIVPCTYTAVGRYHDGLLVAADYGLQSYTVFDTQGRQKSRFTLPNGLRLDMDGWYSSGVIPFYGFDNAQNRTRSGYVNLQGEIVLEGDYLVPRSFSEGLAVVLSEDFEAAVIRPDASALTPFQYADSQDYCYYREGMLVLEKEQEDGVLLYGALDLQGREVIPFCHSWLSPFSDGMARIVHGEDNGYIDQSGKELPGRYFLNGNFTEGLAAVCPNRDSLFGYIDKTERMVIPPQFSVACPIVDGSAIVETQDGLYRLTLI